MYLRWPIMRRQQRCQRGTEMIVCAVFGEKRKEIATHKTREINLL